MARPLSEEKRQALLDAAAEFVARLGTGASTAKIAKAAGVSEGTLFTYFPTKDDLLNQLFLEIEADLTETMLAPYPADASAKDRLFAVWNRLIDWGLAHATARKALGQLKVSDRGDSGKPEPVPRHAAGCADDGGGVSRRPCRAGQDRLLHRHHSLRPGRHQHQR